jgi:1,4-dihydroxy-2-naphthoate octaprenyltransferase
MVKRFLSYVEIMTKITSTFTFVYTVAFLLYKGQPIRWGLTFLFFGSMFLFDLTTTAINNYIDTKNNHQTLQFPRRTALIIILSVYDQYRTRITIGLAGPIWWCFWSEDSVSCAVCFIPTGRLPISRMPLGEVMSGIFYGLLIPFLLLYQSARGTYLTYMLICRQYP